MIYYYPGFMNRTGLFQNKSRSDFVSTSVVLMNENEELTETAPTMPPGLYAPPDGLLAMVKYSKAWFAGTLYRRDIVGQIGAHDQQLRGASDTDFDLRIASRFPFFVTAEPGAVFSVHAASTSVKASHDFVWHDMLRIIQKLSNDETIPPANRTLAAETLSHNLEHYMFQLGIVYALRGQWNEARQVADIFRKHYHRHDKAIFLSPPTTTSQYIPPVYQVLQAAQKAREIAPWQTGVSNLSRFTTGPCLDQ